MELGDIFKVKPSPRQLAWQKLEFYGFIHFGINTVLDVEWGSGHEDISLFNPEKLDAAEWAATLKQAGMKALILTCKHHDGFCLWPSRYSAHTVANTPWREGHGDLVREVAEACRAQGMVFGVYLSPWDRTEQTYGEGKAYDDFYVNQLTELLTNYGKIGCVWLDGANGEGPSGKKQYYDWDRYYETVRRLQPDCVISVCGPDIRWVGNEAGQTRKEEWSVVPVRLRDAEKTAEKSQQADDGTFSRSLNSMDEDLGSRAAIAAYGDEEWVWYPAEVNTSIRPGWFYHASEDAEVRSGAELFDIYLNTVGGNGTFLLNIPPNAAGEIAEADREALSDLGSRIARLNASASALEAAVTASSGGCRSARLDLGEEELCWKPEAEDFQPWVELAFPESATVDYVILQEQILEGQRVEGFELWCEADKNWSKVAEGTIIGYKKIISLPRLRADRLKVVFKAYREYPTLAHLRAVKAADN